MQKLQSKTFLFRFREFFVGAKRTRELVRNADRPFRKDLL